MLFSHGAGAAALLIQFFSVCDILGLMALKTKRKITEEGGKRKKEKGGQWIKYFPHPPPFVLTGTSGGFFLVSASLSLGIEKN